VTAVNEASASIWYQRAITYPPAERSATAAIKATVTET
jgi:hypothetical protein